MSIGDVDIELENELFEANERIEELQTMVKLFKGCIETKLIPAIDSQCHMKVSELSEDKENSDE